MYFEYQSLLDHDVNFALQRQLMLQSGASPFSRKSLLALREVIDRYASDSNYFC